MAERRAAQREGNPPLAGVRIHQQERRCRPEHFTRRWPQPRFRRHAQLRLASGQREGETTPQFVRQLFHAANRTRSSSQQRIAAVCVGERLTVTPKNDVRRGESETAG
jgi:hypothetical protein